LKFVLRNRIRMALKRESTTKSLRSIELLGCSIPKFREHIEKQFIAGMSWETHGRHGWHLVYFVLYFFNKSVCFVCIIAFVSITHTHTHTYSRTISSRAPALI